MNIFFFLGILIFLFKCGSDPVSKLEKLYWSNPPIYYRKSNIIESIYTDLQEINDPSRRNSTAARILLWRCALHLNQQTTADSLQPLILSSNPHLYPLLTGKFELEDELLRTKIILLLAEKENPDLYNFFKKALEEDEYYSVQKAAAYALGRLKNPKILPLLIQRSAHKDPAVRTYAIEALSQFHNTGANRRLAEIVLDPNELDDLRYIAGKGLATINNHTILDSLAAILPEKKDKSSLFIANAISSSHNSDIVRNTALKYIDHKNPFFEGIAIEILGNIHSVNSLPLLKTKLKYGNRQTRLKVVQTLIKFPDNLYAIELLRFASDDANQAVSREAKAALQNFACSEK